jgi:hypothetical protein
LHTVIFKKITKTMPLKMSLVERRIEFLGEGLLAQTLQR